MKIFVKISMFLSLITKSQRLAGDGFLRDTRYLLRDHHEVRLEYPGGLASQASGLGVDGKIYNATVRLPKRLQTIPTKVYNISYPSNHFVSEHLVSDRGAPSATSHRRRCSSVARACL